MQEYNINEVPGCRAAVIYLISIMGAGHEAISIFI